MIMEKDVKRLSCAVIVSMMLFSTVSRAACVTSDRGSPHADTEGKTRLMVTQQAHNKWQDWYWRGINHGQNARCPDNNVGPCKFTWSNAVATSTTIGFGGGVTGGFRDAKWFETAQSSLQAAFNFTYQKQTVKTDTYAIDSSYGPGWFSEPVMIQVRQWKRGYFKGGWVEKSRRPFMQGRIRGGTVYCYDFDENQTFGEWTSNVAVGAPYRTFNIHR